MRARTDRSAFSSFTTSRAGRATASLAVVAVAALASGGARSAAAQTSGTSQPPATSSGQGSMAGMAGMDMSHDSSMSGMHHDMRNMGGMSGMHSKAPHGGQVAMAGSGHVELHTTSTGDLHVWLYDAAMKPAALPASGSVMLTRGSNTVTVPLAADPSGKMLMGRFDAATYGTGEAVVHLPMAGGTERTARFTLAAAK